MNSIHFTDFSSFEKWVEVQRRFSPKESLDKMVYLCELFDHPERKFKSIHITGTNGKGSCVAYLRSILKANGLKVATYTSPHVISFNERIGYDMEFIPQNTMMEIANRILLKYEDIQEAGFELPSFFEFITLLAFIYFSELPDLDIAIIEVGMGGRLDATNLITPIISIISNVAMDHMKQLGDTIEKIATEKLGIVKPGVPLILGSKIPSIQKLAKKVCLTNHSKLVITEPNQVILKRMDLEGSEFSYKEYENIEIPLAGYHQIENALVVYETIQILNEIVNKTSNFYISKEIFYKGMKETVWPGRFEIIKRDPLIVLDGAHNIDGITRLCEFIKQLPYSYKRCIISISHDKAIDAMMKILDATFDEVVCTSYFYHRSASALDLYNTSKCKNKVLIESLEDAINYSTSKPVPFTIFIGSLYLVSDVREIFMKQ